MESATRRARTMVRWVLAGEGVAGRAPTSSRPMRWRMRSALSVVFSSVWLPHVVLTPATMTFGFMPCAARMMAMASSWPGSQSSHRYVVMARVYLNARCVVGTLAKPTALILVSRAGPRAVSAARQVRTHDRDGRANARPRLHFDARRGGSTTARVSSFVIATRAARAVDSPIARAFVRRNPPTTRG